MRVGAGLALSALITPLIYLLGEQYAQHFVPIALLITLTAILGVYLGYQITRRELKSWVHSIARRTERIFTGEASLRTLEIPDFETYLEDMAASLELILERQLQHERNSIIGTISSLISALEARDPSTRNHSTRVAKLSVRISREMGLNQSEQYEIHLGGLLHDVGKIGIPDAILLKPGGLTPEEYEVMKSHSILGARMLAGISGLEAVSQIVLTHHEMFDGNGYPNGLSGEEIPIGARIIAVSDTYMSMAEDRPYRDGRSLEKVLRELSRVAGQQLDPKVVKTLEEMLRSEVARFGVPIDGFTAHNAVSDSRSRAA
jgi:putative nucleotidyltransferase with HDIG domain